MERLLAKLSNKNQYVKVMVMPETYCTKDCCFYNVQDKIARDQGKIVFGWRIHNTQLILEAERHAVWKSPEGNLIDVTPGDSLEILFLEEDKGWTYKGGYTDNIRINKTNNPLVDDFILICETVTELWQTARRKSKYEIIMLEPIKKMIDFFEKDKTQRLMHIYSNGTKDGICFCGKNLKYKDCHGTELNTMREEVRKKVNELIKNIR